MKMKCDYCGESATFVIKINDPVEKDIHGKPKEMLICPYCAAYYKKNSKLPPKKKI